MDGAIAPGPAIAQEPALAGPATSAPVSPAIQPMLALPAPTEQDAPLPISFDADDEAILLLID